MKIKGWKCICKICSDGRCYAASWAPDNRVPKELGDNEIVLEDFPDTTNGGTDYVWDGSKLHYAPPDPGRAGCDPKWR